MKQPVYNPFLPLHEYIPDGEPHVFGDRVYLFGSHDKEGGDTFCMLDYTVWSAPVTDLSDWRCEGTIYKASQDPLYNEERPYMYAPDVVQGNDGRYYLFYCLSGRFGVGGYHGPISVAVCDTPAGAYEYLGFVRYPDGSPMKTYVCFDPGVLNDGGTIRLYYGTQYPFEEQEGFAENEELIRQEMEMFGKSREEILGTPESVMGPSMCVLEDDMLTVRGKPVHIIPYRVRGTSFEGHPFFEAPSMRKIGRKYYFIYSSQLNHELCYAVSDKPDRDFVYGGTIVSNGDVGYLGRTQEQRLNMTGTTHGSIVEIAGQWYVFYHRLTHKSDYSRQACAERITIRPDGSIPQVPITSCGLGEPLPASGTYPAAIACHITNGHMPHGSNSVYETRFPHVTHAELPDGSRERFVAEISDPTLLGFKYFRLHGNDRLVLRLRGTGDGVFSVHLDPAGPAVGMIPVAPHTDWTQAGVQLQAPAGTTPLYLIYHGTGEVSLLDLSFPGAPGKKERRPARRRWRTDSIRCSPPLPWWDCPSWCSVPPGPPAARVPSRQPWRHRPPRRPPPRHPPTSMRHPPRRRNRRTATGSPRRICALPRTRTCPPGAGSSSRGGRAAIIRPRSMQVRTGRRSSAVRCLTATGMWM